MIERSTMLSAIAGVRHGFSTRTGGVSLAPLDSLNVARNLDDDPSAVAENRRRLHHEIGLGAAPLVEVDQVHSATVLEVEAAPATAMQADAIVTRSAGLAVGVRTADCAPILIAGDDVVAAVHAGWRGAVARIVAATVERLSDAGALSVAIGPAIGLDAFEVGDEVIEAARASIATGDVPAMRSNGSWHLDLRGLLQMQLLEIGVSADRIELVGGCTHHHAERYFSYRRERGQTGRHLSVIGRMR